MKCPYCGFTNDRVLDTRIQKDGELIRRRRECVQCKGRFSTQESLMHFYPLVVKKDGRREPFSKAKILGGLQAACQKRNVSLAQMEQIVERVSKWVLNRCEKEVASTAIGQKIMFELKDLDDVAYVRFASVYRTFKDVSEFMATLEMEKDPADPNGGEMLTLTPTPAD